MKLQEQARNVVYGNISLDDLEMFSMKADPIAFEIMSSGIYTHKIRAVVRELSTNAFDENFKIAFDKLVKKLPQTDQDALATIQAECAPILATHETDRSKAQRKELRRLFAQAAEIEPSYEDVIAFTEPIEIHLPNEFEPWFGVRDNGRGMEDAFTRKIFTTYFESDKRNTNNLNGCFGLGSKSPFCYTDQFTVTSRLNGLMRAYSFLVTEKRVPGCLPIGNAEPTDEPNGVEVQVPVEADDFYKFAQEAANIYRWFAVRPNVFGSGDFEWPADDAFLFEGENYKVYKVEKSSYGYRQNKDTHVVMANVAYPVDTDSFDDAVQEQFTEAETRLLNHGVILYVGTGEVKMAASREALQMVPSTVETIKTRLREVSERLIQDVQERIDACDNVWEARLTYREVAHDGVIGTIINKSKHEVTYKGELLEDVIYTFNEEVVMEGDQADHDKAREEIAAHYAGQTVDEKDLKEWQDDAVQKQFASKKKTLFAEVEECSIRNGRRRRSGYGYAKNFHHENCTKIIPTRDLHTIIIDDLDGKGAYVRTQHWMEENGVSDVFLIRKVADNNWLERTGLDSLDILYTSDLEAPMREGRTRSDGTKKKTAKAVVCTGRFSWEAERETWEDATVELEEGGVYVEVHRYRWSAGDLTSGHGKFAENHDECKDFCVPTNLEDFYRLARIIDPEIKIYGLRKALTKRAEKAENWIRLDDWLRAKFEDLSILAEERAKHEAYKRVSVHRKNDLVKMFKDQEFVADSPFGTLIADLHEWQQTGDVVGLNAFDQLLVVAGDRLKLQAPETKDYSSAVADLERRSGELYQFYPMMSLVEWNRVEYAEGEQNKMADYIRLADETRALQHALVQAGLVSKDESKATLKIA